MILLPNCPCCKSPCPDLTDPYPDSIEVEMQGESHYASITIGVERPGTPASYMSVAAYAALPNGTFSLAPTGALGEYAYADDYMSINFNISEYSVGTNATQQDFMLSAQWNGLLKGVPGLAPPPQSYFAARPFSFSECPGNFFWPPNSSNIFTNCTPFTAASGVAGISQSCLSSTGATSRALEIAGSVKLALPAGCLLPGDITMGFRTDNTSRAARSVIRQTNRAGLVAVTENATIHRDTPVNQLSDPYLVISKTSNIVLEDGWFADSSSKNAVVHFPAIAGKLVSATAVFSDKTVPLFDKPVGLNKCCRTPFNVQSIPGMSLC